MSFQRTSNNESGFLLFSLSCISFQQERWKKNPLNCVLSKVEADNVHAAQYTRIALMTAGKTNNRQSVAQYSELSIHFSILLLLLLLYTWELAALCWAHSLWNVATIATTTAKKRCLSYISVLYVFCPSTLVHIYL